LVSDTAASMLPGFFNATKATQRGDRQREHSLDRRGVDPNPSDGVAVAE
jgi:hypothetical protein